VISIDNSLELMESREHASKIRGVFFLRSLERCGQVDWAHQGVQNTQDAGFKIPEAYSLTGRQRRRRHADWAQSLHSTLASAVNVAITSATTCNFSARSSQSRHIFSMSKFPKPFLELDTLA
jgi:hypothetical protein